MRERIYPMAEGHATACRHVGCTMNRSVVIIATVGVVTVRRNW